MNAYCHCGYWGFYIDVEMLGEELTPSHGKIIR